MHKGMIVDLSDLLGKPFGVENFHVLAQSYQVLDEIGCRTQE